MLKEATARRESFVEIFITDRHGYNVAVSNPTSDFVQSDEDWWQRAWENGVDVGEVELDESAGRSRSTSRRASTAAAVARSRSG